jgi:Rod binding domain-containing protein
MTVSPIGAATAPAGAGRTQEEKAALGFERMLLVQLTEQLAESAQPEDGTGDAASNAYRDLLPGALADAMVAAGGVGLAASLVKEQTR